MRMRLVFALIIAVWTILLVRVYYLSIKSNVYYEKIAEKNVVKSDFIAPVRGQIFDIKDRPLAVNKLGFSIWLSPHLRKDQKILDDELLTLSAKFKDLNTTKIKRDYLREDSPYNQEFIEVVSFIGYDEMLPNYALLSLHPNILIKPASKRLYPYAALASHVVGYVGRANQDDMNSNLVAKITNFVGKSGVERYYNSVLQGGLGEKKYKVTALNEVVEEISHTQPVTHDIKLSIDLELQDYIASIMAKDSGVVIVMDLKNGAIIAAGSFPEYDLNKFITGWSVEEWDGVVNHPERMLENKIVRGLYSPGSVVKMSSGMAFLQSGKIAQATKLLCDPYFELGGRKFRNHSLWMNKPITLEEAIKVSCNTYFYRGAYDIGINLLSKVLEKMGFGRVSGVDLPNERAGVVPSPEWKKERFKKFSKEYQMWYDGDTLNTSIGQGNFLVTPIQVAKNTALIATGVEFTPHFLHAVDGDVVKFTPNTNLLSEFEKAQLPYLRHSMWLVANENGGTAMRALGDSVVKLGAKTGTAQVVGIPQGVKERIKEEEMSYFSRSHAWITTFGPYEDPQFVVTVLIEHGGHGGSAGGPLVKNIYQKLYDMGYLKKYEPPPKVLPKSGSKKTKTKDRS